MGESSADESQDVPPLEGGVSRDWVERARAELRWGEKILWIGQPRPSLFARQAWPAAALGMVWALFTAVITAMFVMNVSSNPGNGMGENVVTYSLLLSLFWLIGLAMLSNPLLRWIKAKDACYALTDRRAILWDRSWFGGVEVRSYGAEDLGRMYRVEYPGGGDLVFEVEGMIWRDDSEDRVEKTGKRGFMGIEKVRDVEDLIWNTLLAPDE